MDKVSPLKYKAHPNFERIVAWCVAELLGVEITHTNGGIRYHTYVQDFGMQEDAEMFNPFTYEVMGRLMVELKISTWSEGDDEWAALISNKNMEYGNGPIQAVIFCAIDREFDIPKELIE